MTVRVVVAEDSLLVREGIARLLAGRDDVEIVALCEGLADLLDAVAATAPDVVLTDIRMPPTGTDEGIRAAAHLRENNPDIGVVVLSQYADPGYALELLADGSKGRAYLLKDRLGDAEKLVDAIVQVSQGGSIVDPAIVDVLVQARGRGRSSALDHLTPRESEVLAQIAEGRNNAAVARALILSERAVEKHINSLFSKLGLTEEPEVHRRVMAVLLYLADRDAGTP